MSNSTIKCPYVIAIDGPAGSGKSTVARCVASSLGFTLLDTGALYRSLALIAHESGVAWEDGTRLAQVALTMVVRFSLEGEVNRVFVDGRDVSSAIRTPEISMGASKVSALKEVRLALFGLQRRVAELGPIVAEGRDMGTVVFPDADVKIFLMADPLVRAQRRHKELLAANHHVSFEQILEEQNRRDMADASREVAPLKAAKDAQTIDTSFLTIEDVVEMIMKKVRYP